MTTTTSRSRITSHLVLALTLALAGCTGTLDAGVLGGSRGTGSGSGTGTGTTGPIPEAQPGDRVMRRITAAEYVQTVTDVLEVTPTAPLPEDLPFAGLSRVGAGRVTTNTLAAEQYEAAARDVAMRAFADPARARRLSGCHPTGPADATCARTAIARLGARLFRRPLTEVELTRYADLVLAGAAQTGTFDGGLALATSGLLQSPRFLHHVEIGEAIDATRHRYTGLEMAARLASFLWNSVPDDALREAAARGDLDREEGLRAELARMLRDPRARVAMMRFFDEHLGLDHLEEAVPDVGDTAGIAVLMREEAHRVLEAAIFDAPTRWRDLFDSDVTYVSPPLATYYGLPAPSGSGWSEVRVPAAQRGLLARGGVVSAHGHGGRTSPTLRGLFVRTRLLCGSIPPPPAGVATEISSSLGTTARERLSRHASDPTCAGCHGLMDPIGLGLEQFDARGLFRTHEGTALIDPSGELDGLPFEDAGAMGEVLRDHPVLDSCLARHLFRSAVGRIETLDEEASLDARALPADPTVLDLVAVVVTSDGFRFFR
jgi:hypothetical protein